MKYVFASTVGLVAMVVLVAAEAAQDTKYTTKEVMQKAMNGKDSLLAKVKSGKASDDEKKTARRHVHRPARQTPRRRGTPENWKKKTDALIAAAKSADPKAPEGGRQLHGLPQGIQGQVADSQGPIP